MRALVVEDHARLAATVATVLRPEGMAVGAAIDGNDVLHQPLTLRTAFTRRYGASAAARRRAAALTRQTITPRLFCRARILCALRAGGQPWGLARCRGAASPVAGCATSAWLPSSQATISRTPDRGHGCGRPSGRTCGFTPDLAEGRQPPGHSDGVSHRFGGAMFHRSGRFFSRSAAARSNGRAHRRGPTRLADRPPRCASCQWLAMVNCSVPQAEVAVSLFGSPV
jgi:hypothetical protein